MCYEKSLLTLLVIAEHPEFGPAMETVLFSNMELPGPDHRFMQDENAERLHHFHGEDKQDLKILSEVQDREWGRLVEEQEHFFDRQRHVELLTKIFTSFCERGLSPTVEPTDEHSTGMEGWGTRTLEVLSARALAPAEDDDGPVGSLLSALASSKLELKGLKIYFENFGWHIHDLTSDMMVKECAQSISRTLTRLEIHTCFFDVSEENAVETAELIGICTHLEILTLDFFPAVKGLPAENPFLSALSRQSRPNLKRLDLRALNIPLQELLDFEERHKNLMAIFIGHDSFCIVDDDHNRDSNVAVEDRAWTEEEHEKHKGCWERFRGTLAELMAVKAKSRGMDAEGAREGQAGHA